MGSFIVNFQVKTEAIDRLKAELREIIPSRAYVAPPKEGWVAVYEESTSSQDKRAICRIGEMLSRRLNTHLVAFLVHDSDVLCYWLYERGELLDRFNSNPEYFERVDESRKQQWRGRPDILVRYCLPDASEEAVRKVLQDDVRSAIFVDYCLIDLGALMGIDEPRITLDYEYIGEGQEVTPEELDLQLV